MNANHLSVIVAALNLVVACGNLWFAIKNARQAKRNAAIARSHFEATERRRGPGQPTCDNCVDPERVRQCSGGRCNGE